MIKALIILAVLLGLLMYGLIVATATPNDKHEYEAYMRWKKREIDKWAKTIDEDVAGFIRKERKKHGKID